MNKFYVCALHPFVCFVLNFILIPTMYLYRSNTLLIVNNAFDDVESIKVDYIFKTFGKGAFMDSYLMDYIINYWKQDPEMSLVYHSGECVLLSPLFITVNMCCHFFLLYWFFHVHACMHCLSFFSCPFLFFFLCSKFFKWKPL